MPTIDVASYTQSNHSVKAAMFSTNFLTRHHTIETDSPFISAMNAVHVTGLRYPGGTMTEESFNIREPNRSFDDLGRPLVPLDNFMNFAVENDREVTIVLPTRNLLSQQVDSYGNRFPSVDEIQSTKDFIVTLLQSHIKEHGIDAIKYIHAFELGNEYWLGGSMTSTEYGRIVNILAVAVKDALVVALGDDLANEVGILAQMGSPWGSEFQLQGLYGSLTSFSDPQLISALGFSSAHFGSDGRLNWLAKTDVSNIDIIEQISDPAKDAITGLIEHYYFNSPEDDLRNDSQTLEYIPRDISTWERFGYGDKNIVITEWNVERTNTSQLGLKGASAVIFQFEQMIRMGVDEAFTWPLKQNTTNDFAGSLSTSAILSPSGVVLQHMAAHLPGLQHLDLSYQSSDAEVSAYADDNKIVLYLSSRMSERQDFIISLGDLAVSTNLVSVELVGYDPSSSDGRHFIQNVGSIATAPYTEHDTTGQLTTLDPAVVLQNGRIQSRLGPFEILMLVFEHQSLAGTLGPDTIIDMNGDQVIHGHSGDDKIILGSGNDTIFGGDGSDVLLFNHSESIVVDLNKGAFSSGQTGRDTFYSIEGFSSGTGDDRIFGTFGDDFIDGGLGNDLIDGRLGNDTIYYNGGKDTIFGGVGNDTLILSMNENLNINLSRSSSQKIGGGSITISSIEDIVTFVGHDRISGSTVGNQIEGGSGNDTIYGRHGDDYIKGDGGDDYLYGDSQSDTLSGGIGADRLYGGQGNDQVYGDDGFDWMDGGSGSDTLFGGNGDDTVYGGESNDVLFGGAQNDFLAGGRGNDVLHAGSGVDELMGGLGSDIFVFTEGDGWNIITDFVKGVDKIRIVIDFSSYDDLVFSRNDTSTTQRLVIRYGEPSAADGVLIVMDNVSGQSLSASNFLFG